MYKPYPLKLYFPILIYMYRKIYRFLYFFCVIYMYYG